ncbi:MAG: DivIVA domain-containing protein [Clostridiales bacterium]|nr:DivIVA domain-containing protein [Clostridiales bacterium]
MLLSSEIANKNFRRAFIGYDMEQVDAFLDEILAELDRMQQERHELRERLDAMQDTMQTKLYLAQTNEKPNV